MAKSFAPVIFLTFDCEIAGSRVSIAPWSTIPMPIIMPLLNPNSYRQKAMATELIHIM